MPPPVTRPAAAFQNHFKQLRALTHASHLSDTASVIRDGAIGINGQARRQRGKHAQGSAGDAEHSCKAVCDVDGDGHHKAGDDAGLVAQGKAKDDVSGGTCAAGISNVLQANK